MAVLLDGGSRVVIQGMGAAGQREAEVSRAFGTQVVAGVTPGRGGQELAGVPIRNTVREAADEFGANVSLIFVPAPFAADAIAEAADAGVPVAICITEGIPTLDMVRVRRYLQGSATRLIGPNCPGVMSPGERARAGIMPPDVYLPGNVGVISRSGTLVYETVEPAHAPRHRPSRARWASAATRSSAPPSARRSSSSRPTRRRRRWC